MDDHNSTVLLIDSQDEKAQTKYNTSDKKPKETYIRGEAIKSIVYADLDAIVTCFSLISSISVGHLSSIDVLVLGFANLVADGISMGFGDYMSSGTEKDMAAKERVLTHWEVSNHGESQELELVRRYQAPGMELDDATIVLLRSGCCCWLMCAACWVLLLLVDVSWVLLLLLVLGAAAAG
ncbi:hypothetical protein IFM89_018741 [Coptis chinensis]|uniref:Vacuolar iron transporter n=1 Tax=Coptis chinensis TaxID=261450 RepID=A0A835LMQ0_9MAGN|nr:hypothetical protein IFM89_018741 [Coptis chinensis]